MLMFLFFCVPLTKSNSDIRKQNAKKTILALLDIADKDVGNKASCHWKWKVRLVGKTLTLIMLSNARLNSDGLKTLRYKTRTIILISSTYCCSSVRQSANSVLHILVGVITAAIRHHLLSSINHSLSGLSSGTTAARFTGDSQLMSSK